MSGFELAPVDGGCPVALPPGETVIGRGALLGIADRRVSRKHAVLKVAGNQLSIKPVHINPCFHQLTEIGQWLPLDTDKWHQLSPGDSFSLLADKYIFKVLYTVSESKQRKNCGVHVEDITNPVPATLQSTEMAQRWPASQETKSSSKSQHLEGTSLLEQATEIPKKSSVTNSDTEEQQPVQRKRTLPAWMCQTEITVQNPSIPAPAGGNASSVKKADGKKKMKTENETALETQHVQETPTKPDAKKMEKVKSQRVSQGTKSSAEQYNHPRLENEESALNLDIQACLSTETETTNVTGNQLEGISSKTSCVSEDRASQSLVHQGEFEVLALKQCTERDITNLAESQNLPQSSDIPRHQRTVCQYGRSCYRKNPLHFQQFSHPGDSDYYVTEAETQADTDNRPECPYGTACYRKNPQHKLEYKHTVPPEAERRELRPKAVKKGTFAEQNDDRDDDDDDLDLDECSPTNSFVAHEEDEECDSTDEDYEWDPDIQDQDHEDVDTLLKEGQNFVKSKK